MTQPLAGDAVAGALRKDERVIEAIRKEYSVGIQLFERFQVGDTVAHFTVGDGVVTDKTNESVFVTFEKKMKDGTPLVGVYGIVWFQENPRMLFHRNTASTTGAPS